MSVSCPECSIRYAAELSTCPWCGHVRDAAAAEDRGAQAASVEPPPVVPDAANANEGALAASVDSPPAVPDNAAPTHTETRSAPPPPPPPPGATPTQSGSVTYDLGEIPGPDEEWDPVDEWLEDDQAGEWVDDAPEPISQRFKRWALWGAAGVAMIAFGAFLAEVIPVGIGGGGGSDPTTSPTVAVTTIPPPPTTLPPPVTTVPPPTTTVPVTTTPPFIEPAGAALPTGDLTIFDTGFGQLAFGSDGAAALGRLAATFGQPDADSGARPTPAGEGGGFCEGEMQRVVRWGSLSAYNSVADDGSEVFRSVHLDSANATDPDPAAGAGTLSGLAIGDTTADLRRIYDGFRIEEPGGDVWEIRAGSDGRLLLWGAASEDGTITSIRSSQRCG